MLSILPRNDFGMSLFDDFDNFFTEPFFKKNTANVMKTDLREEDGLYLLSVDLPGYSKDDIKAELKDGYLTVSANMDETNDESDEKKGYIHRERYSGSCSRTFYVGENVKEEDIKAAFKDGTLHLSFPKEAEQKLETAKCIAIE